MFPTCVGMNRFVYKPNCSGLDVPHVRGDEPGSRPAEGGRVDFPGMERREHFQPKDGTICQIKVYPQEFFLKCVEQLCGKWIDDINSRRLEAWGRGVEKAAVRG